MVGRRSLSVTINCGTEFRCIGETIDREAVQATVPAPLCAATTTCTAARRQLRGYEHSRHRRDRQIIRSNCVGCKIVASATDPPEVHNGKVLKS
jgi:hypothetical protein